MVSRKRALYVEGGGDRNPSLASECRKAFHLLFEKAGIAEKPRVIVCGGRKNAYDQFRNAQEAGEEKGALLVDAEQVPALAPGTSVWEHVKQRLGDGWERPHDASDEQLQLMTVCMETWLIADPAALRAVFGPKFDSSKLPATTVLERKDKQAVYRALEAGYQADEGRPLWQGRALFQGAPEGLP